MEKDYAKENNLYVYDLAAKSTRLLRTERKTPLMVLRIGFMRKNLLL
jgi:hypothetical protein